MKGQGVRATFRPAPFFSISKELLAWLAYTSRKSKLMVYPYLGLPSFQLINRSFARTHIFSIRRPERRNFPILDFPFPMGFLTYETAPLHQSTPLFLRTLTFQALVVDQSNSSRSSKKR